jgi:hypothetical protein
MATPRAIRIPRPTSDSSRDSPPPSALAPRTPAPERTTGPVELRKNVAGFQRAFRLGTIYLIALVVLYVAFLLLDRSSPGGTSPAAEMGALYFTGIATLLAFGGVVLALNSAPRAIEVRPDSVVVIAWWGRRREFPPLSDLRVSVVRRFPSSFLSATPVEVIQLGDRKGHFRTYHVEEGLIPEHVPDRPASRY